LAWLFLKLGLVVGVSGEDLPGRRVAAAPKKPSLVWMGQFNAAQPAGASSPLSFPLIVVSKVALI